MGWWKAQREGEKCWPHIYSTVTPRILNCVSGSADRFTRSRFHGDQLAHDIITFGKQAFLAMTWTCIYARNSSCCTHALQTTNHTKINAMTLYFIHLFKSPDCLSYPLTHTDQNLCSLFARSEQIVIPFHAISREYGDDGTSTILEPPNVLPFGHGRAF